MFTAVCQLRRCKMLTGRERDERLANIELEEVIAKNELNNLTRLINQMEI